MKYFSYNGTRIFYRDEGRGDLIVLIHGYLETSEIFKGLLAQLAKDFRVIAPDLPGHGESGMPGQVSGMGLIADILKELLKSIAVEKCIMAGHSMGGYVTLEFAKRYPCLLKAFCLLHSHPFADRPEQKKGRENEISLALSGRKHMFYPEKIRRLYASDNLDKMRTAVELSGKIASGINDAAIVAVLKGMMEREQLTAVIENSNIPLLWILGRHDNLIDAETMSSSVVLNRLSRLVILEKSGHMGFIEQEAETVSALRSFITEMC
jgi:pimeloyl-ACP methyl ester carboxylesterase